MPHPVQIVSQSDSLIQIIDINSHTDWQTAQIQISWLRQKPIDLDLNCLLKQGMSCLAREGFSGTRCWNTRTTAASWGWTFRYVRLSKNQIDQNLHWVHFGQPKMQSYCCRQLKPLIRLRGCAEAFEFSLSAHGWRYVVTLRLNCKTWVVWEECGKIHIAN